MRPKSSKKDIAIIGMSGKFPKSKNITEFWRNLEEGNELIDFYTHSELQDLGVDNDTLNNANYVKTACLINEPGSFDYSFFGYTKEEAALMDPQIRVAHEQAWASLDDAGYNPFEYPNKIGAYFSASDNLNWRTHVMLSNSSNVNPLFIKHISNESSISRLISYSLNLRGPSIFIDSACSSSLVAIHMACRNLLLKECSIALAGGVSISSSSSIGYFYEPGSILSKDGHCRTFDAESSGTVIGEGAGVVVLKKLEDALNDGDHIYSVIKGSSVNNDGNQKVGYTAPSIIGQHNCIKSAIQMAGIESNEITYIEAHGTATNLGDPVEIQALNKAFNYDVNHKCAIGSLKSNLGHMDAAAGVGGVIKTALAIHNKAIPASLHYKVPNPQINFDSGPFFVNASLSKWESQTVRYAGVSSLGIGGTNAHVVMGESPLPENPDQPKRKNQLLIFGAKTKTSIQNFQHNLSAFLDENPATNLADLSYTLKNRKNDFAYRKFAVCGSSPEANDLLNDVARQLPLYKADKQGVVFMFSGQGCQYYQMGKQLYEQFPYFQSMMDEGFSILERFTGENYKSIIGYGANIPAENDQINNTKYTQPLLFLFEFSIAKLLMHFGAQPQQMIGHSLGEYVAACISEVFSLEDGLKLIAKRGQLMSELEQGSMLFVGLPSNKVEELLTNDLSIAAINTEHSCVVSGKSESITALLEVLNEMEIPATILKTSHAFHSEMMNPVLDAFEGVLNEVKLAEPKIPFISCTSGIRITNDEATSSKYWVNHLRKSVQFSKGVDTLLRENATTYIEIGASKTLLSFLRQNKKFDKNLAVGAVVRHPKEKKDDSYYLLNAIGTLWAKGTKINWSNYYEDEKRNKVSAPAYAFDKVIFPCKVNPLKKLANMNLGAMNGTGEQQSFVNDSGMIYGNEASDNLIEDEVERPELEAIYEAPESTTEKELATLWKALFGFDKIGVRDDFFELGGDSLKAMTLLRKIHKSFNVEVSVDDFFDRCDIKSLGKEIDLAISVKQLNQKPKDNSNSKQVRF
jgi:acyl transferase domain-containing protein/acyl carrier protein